MAGILGMLGGGALNTVMDLFTANKDRQFNRDMMREQNDTNLRNNKELTQFNKEQQLDLWQKTNYDAQRKEMEKAGLSVGMMYGMGGGGGTTANVATGSNTGSGTNYSSKRSPIDITNMIATKQAIDTQEAQEELLRAQTNKTNVEATKIEGVDTEETKARTGVARADEALKNMQGIVDGATVDEKIKNIETEADRAVTELKRAEIQGTIEKNTMDEKIKIIQEEAINATIKNALDEANVNNVRADTATKDAMVMKIVSEVNKWQTELYQKDRSLNQMDYEQQLRLLQIKIDKTLREEGLDIEKAKLISEGVGNILRKPSQTTILNQKPKTTINNK